MRLIYNKYDKAKIAELEKVQFSGRIVVIQSEEEAKKAVSYLLSQPIIGLDTETRPSFVKGGNHNKVALLQVATLKTCFLFRLNYIGMPECVKQLLGDKKVTKVGLSWHDDLRMLQHRDDFVPGEFVELQDYVKQIGIKDMSLQKLYANIFGKKISKSQRLTNWEADVLTEAQKVYAATDAWACIKLYQEINRLKDFGDYVLEIIPDPVPEPLTPEQEARRAEKKAKREEYRQKREAAKRRYADTRRRKKENEKKHNEELKNKYEEDV